MVDDEASNSFLALASLLIARIEVVGIMASCNARLSFRFDFYQ